MVTCKNSVCLGSLHSRGGGVNCGADVGGRGPSDIRVQARVNSHRIPGFYY